MLLLLLLLLLHVGQSMHISSLQGPIFPTLYLHAILPHVSFLAQATRTHVQRMLSPRGLGHELPRHPVMALAQCPSSTFESHGLQRIVSLLPDTAQTFLIFLWV